MLAGLFRGSDREDDVRHDDRMRKITSSDEGHALDRPR
jgi:hypothetical protein